MHDLVVIELFDVEYYCDLKMCVKGHSRSLKMVRFELRQTTYDLRLVRHCNYSSILYQFPVI